MAAKGSGGGRPAPAPAASPPARAAASPPPAPAVAKAAVNPPAARTAASNAAKVANDAPSQSNIAKAITAAKVAQAGSQAAQNAPKTTPVIVKPGPALPGGTAGGSRISYTTPQSTTRTAIAGPISTVKNAQAQAAIAARRYEGQAQTQAKGQAQTQARGQAATSGTVSSYAAQARGQAATSGTVSSYAAQARGQAAKNRGVISDTVTSAIIPGNRMPPTKTTVGVKGPNVEKGKTETKNQFVGGGGSGGKTTTGGGKTTTGGGKTTTGGGKTQSTSGLTPRQQNEQLRQDLLNAQSQGNVTLVNQISKQLLQGNRNNQNIRDLINATKIDTRFTLSEQNRQKAEQMLAEGKQTEAESYIRAADAYSNSMNAMFDARGNKIKNNKLRQEVGDRTVAQTQRVRDTWANVFKPVPPVTEVIEDPVPEVQPFIFSPPPFIPSPPAQTLSPGRDVINFSSDMASPEALEQLYFELISGYELVNIARRDTIDGQSEAYTLISNLSSIRRDLDPSIIIYAQEPFRFTYDRYAIDLNDRIPGDQYLSNNNIDSFFYIDNNGDLVIELDNLKNDEEIELQIANSGKIT